MDSPSDKIPEGEQGNQASPTAMDSKKKAKGGSRLSFFGPNSKDTKGKDAEHGVVVPPLELRACARTRIEEPELLIGKIQGYSSDTGALQSDDDTYGLQSQVNNGKEGEEDIAPTTTEESEDARLSQRRSSLLRYTANDPEEDTKHYSSPHPDLVHDMTPLPMGPPGREDSNSLPGAFHSGAFRSGDGTDLTSNFDDFSSRLFGNLAVARIINEDLPEAELREKREDINANKQKFRIVLASSISCVFVLVFGILMGVLAEMRKDNQSDLQSLSMPPSSSPSFAPTSMQSHLLSLLPDYTLEAIQQQESSQARAFQWMLDDFGYNPILSFQRTVQRFSLACLYFSTGGERWTNNNFWLNHTVHECDWHNGNDFAMKGLMGNFLPGYMCEFFPPQEPQPTRCDETSGLFQHLWLDQNNMNGPIPLELYLLTSLQTLSMGVHNQLQGTISSHIGQLTALEGLVLDHMQSNGGPIPTQIGLLTKLRGLSLSKNEHTGAIPSQLGLLTDLQTFGAADQELTGQIPDVRMFPKLKWMVVQGNHLTGTIPTEIGLIEALDWFTAGGNNLDGTMPSQIGMLSTAGMISLYFNQLEGTLPTQVGLLTSSTLLSFRGNLFSGTMPSQIGLLANLSVALTLHDNPMLTGTIPTQLGLLTNLYELHLSNNTHTGPIPSQLGMLRSLGELGLGKNSFSGTIPLALGSLQESLVSFEVDGNPLLSGTIPASLCNINGTCITHSLRSPCIEGTHVAFNCTGLLCGCGCSCGETAANRTFQHTRRAA